jgi:hypothetical protein
MTPAFDIGVPVSRRARTTDAHVGTPASRRVRTTDTLVGAPRRAELELLFEPPFTRPDKAHVPTPTSHSGVCPSDANSRDARVPTSRAVRSTATFQRRSVAVREADVRRWSLEEAR